MKCEDCDVEMKVRYLYGVDAFHDALLYECPKCRRAKQEKLPHDEEPIRYNKGFNLND